MMYNYFDNMKSDIMEYINKNVNLNDYVDNDGFFSMMDMIEDIQGIVCDLWDELDDDIAKRYVMDNISLLEDSLHEFGVEDSEIVEKFFEEDFKYFDLYIRIYLLDKVLFNVGEDIEKKINK